MKKSTLSFLLVSGLAIGLAVAGGCAPAEGQGGSTSIIYLVVFLVLIIGMFYLLTIRPMRQRERKHDEMVSMLQKGDKVITASGIYGQIESIDENSVTIRVESGATLRVTKGSILVRAEEPARQ